MPALTGRWLDLVRSESGQSGAKLFRDIAALVSKDELAEATVLTDATAWATSSSDRQSTLVSTITGTAPLCQPSAR